MAAEEAKPERREMAGKEFGALRFRQIGPNAGGEGGSLHQCRDLLIVEAIGSDIFVRLADAAEDGAAFDLGESEPLFERRDGAGGGESPRPISTSRKPVLPRMVRIAPSGRMVMYPVPSSLWPGPQSSPVISERRKAPAKPKAEWPCPETRAGFAAGWRSWREAHRDKAPVSSPAARHGPRRMPAMTSMMCRSWRGRGVPAER